MRRHDKIKNIQKANLINESLYLVNKNPLYLIEGIMAIDEDDSENKNLINEITPHSISTGIIYFVCQRCNLNINKRNIHYFSKISEVTINKCFKKLENYESIFLPKQIKEKYNII